MAKRCHSCLSHAALLNVDMGGSCSWPFTNCKPNLSVCISPVLLCTRCGLFLQVRFDSLVLLQEEDKGHIRAA